MAVKTLAFRRLRKKYAITNVPMNRKEQRKNTSGIDFVTLAMLQAPPFKSQPWSTQSFSLFEFRINGQRLCIL